MPGEVTEDDRKKALGLADMFRAEFSTRESDVTRGGVEAIAEALSAARSSSWTPASVDPAGEQRALLCAFMKHPASAVMLWWVPGGDRHFDYWMELPALPTVSVHVEPLPSEPKR